MAKASTGALKFAYSAKLSFSPPLPGVVRKFSVVPSENLVLQCTRKRENIKIHHNIHYFQCGAVKSLRLFAYEPTYE